MNLLTLLRPYRLLWLACLVILPGLVLAEEVQTDAGVPAGEMAEEFVPFASLPYAARMELNEALLTIWEFVDQGGDVREARLRLLTYLRSAEGKALSENGFLANSFMYHVLLGRAGLLSGVVERMADTENKGLHWFVQGMMRIYENKSAQASGSFAKGIFSSLLLNDEDYQRLKEAGIKVQYFPSMTPYSNAAFIAGRFYKMTFQEQEEILNVAQGRKISRFEVNPADLNNPNTISYQLQSLYYNLSAYLVMEGHNDLYAIQEFSNHPSDLFERLREKFGYDAREIFEGLYNR